MLLLDDDDRLPSSPQPNEVVLLANLGADAVPAIDAAILARTRAHWLKVARVLSDVVDDMHFDPWSEPHLAVCLRRIVALVNAHAIQAQGDPYRPRFSEVRLPQ